MGTLRISKKIKSILLSLTGNPDEEIRFEAFEALWEYTGEDVLHPVVARLKDDNELVRMTAAESLSNLRDKDGMEHLVNALTDENEIVRRDAEEGLGKLGDTSTIPVLQAFLQNETAAPPKLVSMLASIFWVLNSA